MYCTVLLPPGVHPIAVKKYIVSYHKCTHTHTHEEGTSGFAAKLRGNKHELRLDDYINVDVTETDRDGENWIKLARG